MNNSKNPVSVVELKKLAKYIITFPLVLVSAISRLYCYLLSKLFPKALPFWLDEASRQVAKRTTSVKHILNDKLLSFEFYAPNALCQWRGDTFSIKEPDTLVWIDDCDGDGAFFDIGANVGLYSIYYAKTKQGSVYAFEPSVFNLGLLAKNININEVQHKIKIVPNPLTTVNDFADFNLQVTDEGGALSSFGVDHGQDGRPLDKVMSYQTCGFSLDYLLDNNIITERPAMIKVDVDGIEHLILRGAVNTISHPSCKSVLIEVHNEFKELSDEVADILTSAGFIMRSTDGINQIWSKTH
jgi:FkbM family methyltransferase